MSAKLVSILNRILPKLYVSESGDVLLDPNCNGDPIQPSELEGFCQDWLGNTIKPIRNDEDLQAAFNRIEELWKSDRGTPEGDELDVILVLVESYEREHVQLPPGDPVELIEYKLGELGMTRGGLSERLGWNIALVLNRRRELTLKEAYQIRMELKLPRGCFL